MLVFIYEIDEISWKKCKPNWTYELDNFQFQNMGSHLQEDKEIT